MKNLGPRRSINSIEDAKLQLLINSNAAPAAAAAISKKIKIKTYEPK
jgi:hypothetical protein